MALIKVNSWVQLSPNGGLLPSPVDLVINDENIVGIEARKTLYGVSGRTNVMYNYSSNSENYLVELIVSDNISTFSGNWFSKLTSFNSIDGTLNEKTSVILLNSLFVDSVKTKDEPYLTIGITDVVANAPLGGSYSQTTYIVTETADSLVTTGGGGSVNSVSGNIVNNSDPENPVVDFPIGNNREVPLYKDGDVVAGRLGWAQFSDLPTPPSFSNGVLTGTAFQPDGSALWGIIQLALGTGGTSIVIPNAIPFYNPGQIGTGGGTLAVANAINQGDAVNLSQLNTDNIGLYFLDNLSWTATSDGTQIAKFFTGLTLTEEPMFFMFSGRNISGKNVSTDTPVYDLTDNSVSIEIQFATAGTVYEFQAILKKQ